MIKLQGFEDRLTQTTVKDLKGSIFDPNAKLIDRIVDVYELSPTEAKELNEKKHVLRWIHKVPHKDGDPKLRLYHYLGQWKKVRTT